MDQRSPRGLAREFEEVCARILQAEGFENETDTQNYRNPNPADFIGRHRDTGRLVVAEIKLYLSSQAPTERIERAIQQLLSHKQEFPEADLILILSIPLRETLKTIAAEAHIAEVWDLPILAGKTSVNPILGTQLDSILTKTGVGDVGTLGISAVLPEVELGLSLHAPALNRGEQICGSLRRISEGRSGWREFEDQCREALMFLFGEHFGYWSTQSETEDKLHRRDFVVRLRPKSDFWASLAHDFRSRYIVFEFKNYKDRISQDQIYSTEKYLYTTALRSVAIVVARNGANDGAWSAAGGALREAGKLILILSLADLCEMLHARDRADDPELTLHEILDVLLTGLGR